MIIDGYQADALMNNGAKGGTTGETTGTISSETINPPKMIGWICPVCGRGLSPFTAVCPCKNDGKGWKITY